MKSSNIKNLIKKYKSDEKQFNVTKSSEVLSYGSVAEAMYKGTDVVNKFKTISMSDKVLGSIIGKDPLSISTVIDSKGNEEKHYNGLLINVDNQLDIEEFRSLVIMTGEDFSISMLEVSTNERIKADTFKKTFKCNKLISVNQGDNIFKSAIDNNEGMELDYDEVLRGFFTRFWNKDISRRSISMLENIDIQDLNTISLEEVKKRGSELDFLSLQNSVYMENDINNEDSIFLGFKKDFNLNHVILIEKDCISVSKNESFTIEDFMDSNKVECHLSVYEYELNIDYNKIYVYMC